VLGLWPRNLASLIAEGDESGAVINALVMLGNSAGGLAQGLPAATRAPDLHVNYYPNENAQECESNNETFQAGRQAIGNPAGLQGRKVEITRPPASATAAARRAGLLGGTP
jgi:hypothetical protein